MITKFAVALEQINFNMQGPTLFRTNRISIMAADTLDPQITRASSAITLIITNGAVVIYLEDEYQEIAILQYQGLI